MSPDAGAFITLEGGGKKMWRKVNVKMYAGA